MQLELLDDINKLCVLRRSLWKVGTFYRPATQPSKILCTYLRYLRTVDRATIAKNLNERTELLSNTELTKKKLHLHWNQLQFFFQANDLVKSLMASTPSYVRTIKPNETKLPGKRSFKTTLTRRGVNIYKVKTSTLG